MYDQNMGQQAPPPQMNSNPAHHKVNAPPTQLGVSRTAARFVPLFIGNMYVCLPCSAGDFHAWGSHCCQAADFLLSFCLLAVKCLSQDTISCHQVVHK